MAFRLNAGPLASALAAGQRGRREGEREQYEREQGERQYQDSMLMRELAMRNQQEQTGALNSWREQQVVESQRRAQQEQEEAAAAAAQLDQAVKALIERGVPPAEAQSVARNPQLFQQYMAPPKPPEGPKAPVRGTPEYLKAIEDEERVRDRFRNDRPNAADTPGFLRPNAIEKSAAGMVQPQRDMWGDITTPALSPADAAKTARRQNDDQRQAAFEVERDQLRELYERAYENAQTPEEKDRATRAYMDAQKQMGDKYRIGKP